ncbi:MAG TPA: TonB-dependent receptor [Steroidobacteraceae bacterium]
MKQPTTDLKLLALNRQAFMVSSTATGCAIFLLASGVSTAQTATTPPPATSSANAAEPGEPAVEEVVVSGIRAAIESAITTKQVSQDIVESISAEDIGKLPDTTIAESLARLPGVTTQRDQYGNATTISIRGLGPDFNGYLLNGREQTSTASSRAPDLSVYPAELIASATVYKSGDAALMTAGLAGTIDNRLVDPLAYNGLVAAANYQLTRNNVGVPGLTEGKGKRYSLSFIDQFADRKIGIALGFVHSDSDSNTFDDGSWGCNCAVFSGPSAANPGTSLGNFSIPFGGGLDFETDVVADRRNGGVAILEFKPTDSFTSEVDYYQARIFTGTKKNTADDGTNGSAVYNGVVNGTTVTSGTFYMNPSPAGGGPGSSGVLETPFVDRSEDIFEADELKSIGWRNTLNFNDQWAGTLDINHNSAESVQKDIEVYAQTSVADTLSFTNGGSPVPHLSFGTPSIYTTGGPTGLQIMDKDGWSGTSFTSGPYTGDTVPQDGYDKGPDILDQLNAVRLDFSYKFGQGDGLRSMFSTLQFGANYTDRSKQFLTDEGVIINSGANPYAPIAYPPNSYIATNVGGTGLDLLQFDPQAGLFPGAVVLPKYNSDILAKTWTVHEDVSTLYGKLDIDTHLGWLPVRGNVGGQFVHTQQSSQGYVANDSTNVTLTNPAVTLSEKGVSYNDFLPSINLTGDFGKGNLLRFASAIEIARPEMDQMRNNLTASLDTTVGDATYGTIVGSAGNPMLKPFKADAVDLSYEKYFGNRGYLSAAVFYKYLQTYISQTTYYGNYDFTQIANQLGIVNTINPGNYMGTNTITVNGQGGNLRGVEFAVSFPFDMLTSWLEGFGVSANYASTLSSVKIPNTENIASDQQAIKNSTIPLPGLSHINDKYIVYFERWGFSAFFADNHRSSYIGSVGNVAIGGYPELFTILPQTWTSAQVGYTFLSGPAKGLGLRFEGNNLNKPVYEQTSPTGNTVDKTGATYYFRVDYKFQQ